MATKVQHEVRINAPKAQVWNTIADFGGIYKFNPGVPTSHSTSEANEGVGATRHCDLLPMGSIEERITEWHEGESYSVEIYDGKMMPPIKNAVGTVGVKSKGNDTIAFMELEYESKLGIIGAVMNATMLKSQFDKTVLGVLQGLKHHIETGEEVDRNVYKRIRTAMSPA